MMLSHKNGLQKFTKSVFPLLPDNYVLNVHIVILGRFRKVRKIMVNVFSKLIKFSYRFRHYPPINTLEENDKFCHFLKGLLNEQ